MRITELQLKNFRNLRALSFVPDPGVNVIYGDNAQGKTNLLEAIWLLSGARSGRSWARRSARPLRGEEARPHRKTARDLCSRSKARRSAKRLRSGRARLRRGFGRCFQFEKRMGHLAVAVRLIPEDVGEHQNLRFQHTPNAVV